MAPSTSPDKIRESGKVAAKRRLLNFSKGNGEIRLTVGSGKYALEVRL